MQVAQDPGDRDAGELADFLQRHDIDVRCVTRTKIGSDFLGETRAAGFQTALGPMAVVFFDAPSGAERTTTTVTVKNGHYRYTFTTGHLGFRKRQVMDVDSPLHFLIRGRWLAFVWEAGLEEPLRRALAAVDCENKNQRQASK